MKISFSTALDAACLRSFNDLKFILYLKRGRRAEEKLTRASAPQKKGLNARQKKIIIPHSISSVKWRIDDIS
jgi:hypothetical protein